MGDAGKKKEKAFTEIGKIMCKSFNMYELIENTMSGRSWIPKKFHKRLLKALQALDKGKK